MGKNMKRNLDVEILQLDGGSFADFPTLRAVCSVALVTPHRSDESKTLIEKLVLYRLAQKIIAAPEEVDLSSEDIVLLKGRVNLIINSIVIVGRVHDLLES